MTSLLTENGFLLNDRRTETLTWQSRWLLAVVLLMASGWVAVQSWMAGLVHIALLWQALSISAGFTLMVRAVRAATPAAALTGGLFTACIYFQAPGLHTALWPMAAMLVLTLAATRTGRTKKEKLGIAEGRHGRGAAQVAANLGMAALAALPSLFGWPRRAALVVLTAALAEAAADTLSSELGQVFGGMPRMITSGRRVAPGTDGAITVRGTLAGLAGAAIVTAIAAGVLPLGLRASTIAFGSAGAGLFADSLLGATFERRGWLNNDAVNFLSTLMAGVLAGWLHAR